MTIFERYQCWHQERVGEVINKEAVSVDLADFMATHAPLGHIAYVRPAATASLSEADLLAELVHCGQSDRHVFAVIQGIPGTGKSHLIRWLHQRYLPESGGQDEVLLIERAQNSLLGTLRQIIEKVDVGSDSLRQQIDKLRGAADSLSARALKDSILNNLSIATYEREESTKAKIRRGIERFLLDPVVRDFLKADSGPIDRIANFLTSGRRVDEAANDRPEFTADDFKLRADTLRAVRAQGYPEARDLAEALNLKSDLREDLAIYLNRLLDYAISRTVVLSADDLKQTFNDLRRELRRRGKSLALFVEDITAFTGIDLGLIDVLATQHTGEGNRDFCRVTSVVGITDSYFRDRFPDNLRERVSHHLTLNAGPEDRPEAGLLHSRQAAADVAARYLNAMRADRSTVRVWLEDGGQAERLPNRCDECPFQTECHTAFGFVDIGEAGGAAVEVGLYPFNARAIWNIYQRLDPTSIARTPRSLLNHVLLDVLQSHGRKVIAGNFPPVAKDLAAAVRDMPALAKPVQQRVINEQGGADTARIQSLILYWGDGTVDAYGEGALRTVGGLSLAAFRAFAVRPIAGEPVDSERASVPLAQGDQQKPLRDEEDGQRRQVEVKEEVRRGTKYDADIAKWREGGKLDQYEDLRKFLVAFIKNAIDWTLHGVSAGVVDERIMPGRFEIEGQSGMARGDRLLLPRNDELADVLQALAELDERGGQVEPDALGAHLATLGSWLRCNEATIVSYVRQPSRDQPVPMRLVEMLLLDCLLIEWLCDSLRIDGTTPQELLRTVLKGAGVEYGDRPPSEQDWANQLDRARVVHGRAWVELMRSVRASRARTCRSQLLKQLNQPQGSSSDIRFVDAATALDILSAMRQRKWALRPLPEIDERASATWKDAGAVYILFAARLGDVLEDEQAHQNGMLGRLRELTGDAGPDEIIKAVDTLLGSLRDHNIPHNLGDPPSKAQGMRNMLQYLGSTAAEQDRGQLAVRLSAGARSIEMANGFIRYFEDLVKLASRVAEQQDRQIAQLQADSDAQRLEARALVLYDEVIDLLRNPIPAEEPQEVQP